MIDVVPFKAEHLAAIQLQSAQAYLSDWVSEAQGEALAAQDNSYTALCKGKPLAAAGMIPQWQGRTICWAFIGDVTQAQFLAIHRATKKIIDGCYAKRLEMTVDCDFAQAHRWARLLGFKMEAPRMEAYNPNGGDCSLYARVI